MKESCTEAPKKTPTPPKKNPTPPSNPISGPSLALQTLNPAKLFQRNQTKKVLWLLSSPLNEYSPKLIIPLLIQDFTLSKRAKTRTNQAKVKPASYKNCSPASEQRTGTPIRPDGRRPCTWFVQDWKSFWRDFLNKSSHRVKMASYFK